MKRDVCVVVPIKSLPAVRFRPVVRHPVSFYATGLLVTIHPPAPRNLVFTEVHRPFLLDLIRQFKHLSPQPGMLMLKLKKDALHETDAY